MGRHAALVMGPAGSGKSTFCKVLQDYCDTVHRVLHVINLDPACDAFAYAASADVRDFITVDDVAEEQVLGPNGGLVYAMEQLVENPDWLDDTLGDFVDDYVLFDLPGQIELFTHIPVIPMFARMLQDKGYNLAGVYLMDSSVVLNDTAKYMAGVLSALSAMLMIEVPHISVLTKMDITLQASGVADSLDDFIECEWERIVADPRYRCNLHPKLISLTTSIGQLLRQYPLVAFQPLNITKLESVVTMLSELDRVLQYEDEDDLVARRQAAVDAANEGMDD
eukprot:TRINITY_DN71013_c0_g1_i1.p2 TRINITY_DN71013_c0_g1~~TRINITY_DN71013_c0_g1_i1.p2  ORF type:complete len:314 (+),score=119.10 TRINITY_DN71013_c0_g1_i1:105-944(+)